MKPFVRFYLANFEREQESISRKNYISDCFTLICRQLGAENLPTYNEIYSKNTAVDDYPTNDEVVRILKEAGAKAR